jgi:hypothetical protein
MNKDWHMQNRMPRNASPKERVQWHLGHAKNCSCRPFPKGLLSKLNEEEKRQFADEIKRSAPSI